MVRDAKNKENLEWWHELPFPYSSCYVSEGSRPEGFRFHPHIINIEACLLGREIGACGEASSPELAMTKAVAELLERSALFTHQANYLHHASSSNGWAAHSTHKEAREAAILELVERDAVLSQWYTATPFLEISSADLPLPIQHWRQTELSRSEFPILRLLLSTRGLGPALTCVFMNEEGYGVASHATRLNLKESTESAIAETCRAAHLSLRRAFWRETLKLKAGEDSVKNGAHAVYYAYQEPFPRWMFGPVIDWSMASALWQERTAKIPREEFRFEVALDSPLVVGHVSHDLALPLAWGATRIENVLKTAAGKRLAEQTTEWNLKPHIIS